MATMSGISQPLPGLLDTFQFSIPDLPALGDFHIAPLRDPVPSRSTKVPLPLEPLPGPAHSKTRNPEVPFAENFIEKRRGPQITPNDVLLAREAKKPHLAISELLEANSGRDVTPTQLPSFISLSVVERSPIQVPSSLENIEYHAPKRLKLDNEIDHVSNDPIRRLPRPPQKDGRHPPRPAPLLPAMVTGLHEPPPSAALLPSIDVPPRPSLVRAATSSKIHVKDILSTSNPEKSPPPPVSNTLAPGSEKTRSHLSPGPVGPSSRAGSPMSTENSTQLSISRDGKTRRARRKWSEQETQDLLAGVHKYGAGRWKQILEDPAFNFCERSSVDLKDRYRVCANNDASVKPLQAPSRTPSNEDLTRFAQSNSFRIHGELGEIQATTPSGAKGQPTKQRRKRCAWTAVEDQNLLDGVVKHGFQWTLIHDDPELNLHHRRATDLRDRIRNRFPDGYKHADVAPFRSEVKKAEKTGAVSRLAPAINGSGTGDVDSPAQSPIFSKSTMVRLETPTTLPLHASNEQNRTVSATVHMMIHRTNSDGNLVAHKYDRDKDIARDKEQSKDQTQPMVTLPSFSLGVDDDMDWDNRLPPMHEWDDIGI
ncbi:hypothetical protein PV10_08760 [Exophiala mesophila]|uniref:Myb-like domain-containing protein n=1 Tax=Exophiala mesophila TaxID=212818 RepID=A0A0D1Z5K2_EXOME|nr:uncharacterized protein PV10_08760 [Exophiala mesophila]KIV89169.1 hypothetical protein PV10_08760 [Exophiala mesophila]